MKTIFVSLGPRSHSIHLGTGIAQNLGDICRQANFPQRIALVTDRNVARLHVKLIANSLHHHGFELMTMIMPAGERQKSPSRLNAITSSMFANGLNRSSALIALGGGVVGDVAGFASAIFRRGIRYAQVPTTLLAQVESAVGGKTGVNHPLGKNGLGAFHQPAFILSDLELLRTLPKREIVCGIGEILKYAVIDPGICEYLERHFDEILSLNPEHLEHIIHACNVIKSRMVEEDECETIPCGGRAVLNLGHTIGHALEFQSNYVLRHGEAVLFGLQCELEIAHETGVIDEQSYARLRSLFRRVQPAAGLGRFSTRKLTDALFRNGLSPTFVLPSGVGSVTFRTGVTQATVGHWLQRLIADHSTTRRGKKKPHR